MRNPGNLPPRPPRAGLSDRGRILLIAGFAAIVVLAVAVKLTSGFYVDYLWHISVARGDVFWGVLRAKVLLVAMFAAAFIGIGVLNLVIADRLAPEMFSANMHPVVERFHDIFGRRLRMARIAVAVVLGLLFALPAAAQWNSWLLFTNSQSFGISDPQFGNDVGFYIFRLPFITFVLDWFFAAFVVITLLVLLTHILNGGVVFQPPRPKIRRATKAHLAVMLAVLALLKAGDYWVQRYELTTERRGFVQGATYSVVKAQLPAVVLLVFVAVFVALLFLSTLRTDSWRAPLAGSALWVVVALVGGVIYPAAVQALVVKPNQKDLELKYIERNIEATRQALGITADMVEEKQVSFGTLTADEITANVSPLQNVRLLHPTQLVDRFRIDRGQDAGLTIRDLDIDRYTLDGRLQQVVVAARELDLNTVANRSWQGKHLISTHGCGLIIAPAGTVEASGRPSYRQFDLSRPELYFSEDIDGYAIVNSSVTEDSCPGQTDAGPYEGEGGVQLSSFWRRAAFALDFFDYNLIGSGAIDSGSRILWNRSVRDRVEKIAPFLSFDADPYPVGLEGQVYWVIDAYTTSDRYPYAQDADLSQLTARTGLRFDFNYIRNSVKAVVNAYDGSIALYVIDETDPIVQAYRSAFPNLFSTIDEMPAGLVDHLRYPEDLFRVQTAAYSKYRLDPNAFFDRNGAWSVSQSAPATLSGTAGRTGATAVTSAASARNDLATESASERFVPYYSMFQAPGTAAPSFELFRPFVPFSTDDIRKELQAFMTASSDAATYGKLTVYTVDPLIDGPATVAATMSSDVEIGQQITLLTNQGSTVTFGDMQFVPIGDGALYVRPMFVNTGQVSFRYVLVSYQSRAVFGSSLRDAISKLFPEFRTDVGDIVDGSAVQPPETPGTGQQPDPGTSPSTTVPPAAGSPAELLAQADRLFAEADAALARTPPDFTTYASKNAEARRLVARALALLGAPATTAR